MPAGEPGEASVSISVILPVTGAIDTHAAPVLVLIISENG